MQQRVPSANASQSEFRWLPMFLQPAPPAELITDPEEVRKQYAYYRPRVLFWTTAGYGMFYFVRKNLSVAMPVMHDQLGISNADLGLFLTLHGLLYGVSKFLNGILGDRADGRKFMALGLIISAVLNICFGFSHAIIAFGIFWMLNGWFQAMGYPPCARLLTHWFSPKELATKMALWNTSHSLGAGATVVLCGYLVAHFHDWRVCFFVPAGLAIAMACAVLLWLVDTPESLGLPEIAGTHVVSTKHGGAGATTDEFRSFLWERVFSDKYIWIVAAANFFVYTIRYAMLDWGPTILQKFKGMELTNASWMVAGYEVAGLVGILTTGWLTDRFFRGRAAPICLGCMVFSGLTVFLFWKTPGDLVWLNTALMMATGFFIYGPQALVAVIVANLATKRAAATAVGLTGLFGYASTVLSGWCLGKLSDTYGWNSVFMCLIGIAGIGALLFVAALPAKAHGYADEQPV